MNFNYIDNNCLYIINKHHYNGTIQNCLRISKDCAELINTTKKPNIFFTRYNLLISIINELITVEKKYKLKNPKPSEIKKDLMRKEPYTIDNFIDRYYQNTILKVNSLKTVKAKENSTKKFLADIQDYYIYMDKSAIFKLNNLYNSIIDNYKLTLKKVGYSFCKYCGKQIKEDSIFCTYCGKKRN